MNGRSEVRVEFRRPFAPPQREGYGLSLLTQKQWDALAETENCWRLDLRQDPTEPHTDGVGLRYQYGTQDTKLEDCTIFQDANEQAYVTTAVADLQEELDELRAKPSPTVDDLDRIEELEARQSELRSSSFWRESRNPFGDGHDGVYRALAEPNVPGWIRTNEVLEADRPFTLWITRYKPLEEQMEPEMRIRFGRRWRLILQAEKGAKLQHFTDDLTEAQRAAYETELQTIEDSGRLTVADRRQIKTWKDRAEEIIVAAKADGRKKKEQLSTAESAEIADLKRRVQDLKEGKKGLSDAEQRRRKILRELLYVEETDVNLYANVTSLWGQPLVLTFIPQQRGYMTVANNFGANYWTYEYKDLVATKEFGEMLGAAPIEIWHNGGSYVWKWSYVQPESRGHLLSRPWRIGFEVAEDEIHFEGKAALPPGTTADASIVLVDSGVGLYQWRIDLTSDGRYLPFVYTCNMEVEALPRDRSVENLLFRAADAALCDVVYKYEGEYRARGCDISLLNEDHSLYSLVREINGAQVFVWEGDVQTFAGVVQSAEEKGLDAAGHFQSLTVRATDRRAILRKTRTWFELLGDNLLLSEVLRRVHHRAGFHDDELRIAEAPALRLPAAAVGQEALIKADFGDDWAGFVDRLLESYGNGMDAYYDGAGAFVFERRGQIHSPLRFVLSQSEKAGPMDLVVSDPTVNMDPSDFYNFFVVLGAKKPGQKKTRYSAVYANYASVFDRSYQWWVGFWRMAPPLKNDELNTQELANGALRRQLELHGTPALEITFQTDYHRLLLSGQRCPYGQLQVEVVSVDTPGRYTGRCGVKVRVL